MNKLLRFFIIIIILGVLLGGFYYLFMRPAHYTDQNILVTAYLSDFDNEHCNRYFIEETEDICINFNDLLVDQEFTVSDVSSTGNEVTVTLTLNDVETTFTFLIETVEVTGLRGILTEEYYFIDTITD